jgi:hypothetical protein
MMTASTDNLQLNMESKPLPEAQYTLHLHSDFVKRGDNAKKKKSIMYVAGIKTENLHLRQYHMSRTISHNIVSLVEIFMYKTNY